MKKMRNTFLFNFELLVWDNDKCCETQHVFFNFPQTFMIRTSLMSFVCEIQIRVKSDQTLVEQFLAFLIPFVSQWTCLSGF